MMYKVLICVIFACMALNVHAQNNTTTTVQPASGNVIVSTAPGNGSMPTTMASTMMVSSTPGPVTGNSSVNGSVTASTMMVSPTTAPTPKTTINGKLKITGVAAVTEDKIIEDKSSPEYKNFTTDFSDAVEKIVKRNSKCAVTKVTKGSLVVEFTSTFDAANGEDADKALTEIGNAVKTGSLGKYTTDKESFVGSLSGHHAPTTEPSTGVNVVSMGTVTLFMATAAVMKALF